MNCRHFGVLDASSIAGIPQTHFSVKKKKKEIRKFTIPYLKAALTLFCELSLYHILTFNVY